jgi:hypothetical protein
VLTLGEGSADGAGDRDGRAEQGEGMAAATGVMVVKAFA